VLEVNMFTMSVSRTFAIGGLTQAMALAPDNSELYVANENGNMYVVTLESGAVAPPVPLGGSGFGLALGPDGSTIFVGLFLEGQIKVVGRTSRNVMRTIRTGGSPREMAVDPVTQLVVVANLSGWVDLVR
jgi:DNA-binding beta-propeller fold protein YncE